MLRSFSSLVRAGWNQPFYGRCDSYPTSTLTPEDMDTLGEIWKKRGKK